MQKKFLTSTFLFIFCMIYYSHSQDTMKEFVISERIGSEIDANEKIYFHLFPYQQNFISAKVFKKTTNEYFFEIKYDSLYNSYTKILPINEEEIQELKRAIDEYEYCISEELAPKNNGIKWNMLIRNYLYPKYRYDKGIRMNIEIKTKTNEIVKGDLLYVDKEFLFIVPNNYNYDWKTIEKNCRLLHYSEIKEFIEPNHRRFSQNKYIYLLNYNYLEKYQPFIKYYSNDTLPLAPELYSLLKTAETKYTGYSSPKNIVIEELNIKEHKKFHASLFCIPYTTVDITNKLEQYKNKVELIRVGDEYFYSTTLKEKFKDIDIPSLSTMEYGFSFNYNIFTKYRVGFNFKTHASEDIADNTYGASLKTAFYDLYMSYVLRDFNPYYLSNWERFAVCFSLGVSYADIDMKINVTKPIENPKNFYKIERSYNPIGAYLDTKIDYYLTSYLSLNTTICVNMFLPTKFEEWAYNYSNPNATVPVTHTKILEKDLMFLHGSLKFGVSMHF